MDLEDTDRDQALWLPEPVPETMCTRCDGSGTVLIYGRRQGDGVHLAEWAEPAYRALWAAAERADPTDHGFHFVRCLDCHGTGRREA